MSKLQSQHETGNSVAAFASITDNFRLFKADGSTMQPNGTVMLYV